MGKAEGIVENYLKDKCKENGIFCTKFVSPGNRGVPDEILIYNGRVLFVETKSEVGNTSRIQDKRIAEMRKHGAEVHICHTKAAIDKLLKDILPDYHPSASRPAPKQSEPTIRRKPTAEPVIRQPICTQKG